MNDLKKAVEAYSKINNTVVGCMEKGILTCDDDSNYALPLDVALGAMKEGKDAMVFALENYSADLGPDYDIM